jgi:hypothetical protein
LLDKALAQGVVDLAKPADAHARTKLVDHSHIGQVALVGQMGEGAPRALFRQRSQQQIEPMDRREQN